MPGTKGEACINGRKRCKRTTTRRGRGLACRQGKHEAQKETSLQIIGKIAKQAHVTFTPQRRLTGNSLPNLEVLPAALRGTFPSMLRSTLAKDCTRIPISADFNTPL